MFFCGLELGTLSTHSGYNFPFNHSALKHAWHHYMSTENFGPTGVLDAVYETNVVFKAWLAELSHRDSVAKSKGDMGAGAEDVYTQARKEIAKREASGQRVQFS